MSLLSKQKELEGASDGFLQQLLQQGSREYPGWLVAAVADQRAYDRQLFANAEAMARAEEPKVTDQISAKLMGGIPGVDPNQMGDPSLATGIAGGMAAAGGGMIPKYQTSGLVGDDDDDSYYGPEGNLARLKEIIGEQSYQELQENPPLLRRVALGVADTLGRAAQPIVGDVIEEVGEPEAAMSGSAPFSAEIVNEEVLENPSMTSEGMQDVMRGRRDIVTGEEITEDDIPSAQSYADQLIAEMRAQREQNATTMSNLLGQGFGLIDDYEAARQPNADDRAIYRRERRDLRLALSQARRVADERGANAEERQEIYDNLKADLEAQADQRAATRARRREVRGIRARGIGLGSLGTAEGRGRMSRFTEGIFEEDIAAEDRERTAIREDAARLLSDLTSLQDYEEATGKNLDQAVLAESRGQTTLLGNLLDTDESLEQDVLGRRLSLIERALSPAASLEAANERAAAAVAAARNAQTVSEFERRFFDPAKHVETLQFFDNWIQNVEEDPDLTENEAERERLIEDIRRVKTVYFSRAGQDFMTGLGATVAGIPELTSQRVTTPTGFTDRMLRDVQQRYSDGN